MTIKIISEGEELVLTDFLERWLVNDYRRYKAWSEGDVKPFLVWLEGQIEQASLVSWNRDQHEAARMAFRRALEKKPTP